MIVTFPISQVILLLLLNVVRLSYGNSGYDLQKSAAPADGCVHPIFIPVYTKAESLPEQELYYNKVVQPSPASYTPSPLVSIYVASTPKPYVVESEKVYGAEVKYAAQVAPKISYAIPVTKQSYADAIYQSTAKPNYAYASSSEKYSQEVGSKYHSSAASSAYSSSDYAHTGKSYASVPVQYQFIAPAVGYVSSTPAPLKYHSSAAGSYSHSLLNKASHYDQQSYDSSYDKASYYPSSTPVYPALKSHSYIKQSPSYVSSTPAYLSYPSSTPSYPTYSSTVAPYPAYESVYLKQSPPYVASHSATYAAGEKESAEHYYSHASNADYGNAHVKYAGSYSKEYLPPTSVAYSLPAYTGSPAASYKGYAGQSHSNSYYNSGASHGHQNAYHSKSAAYQSPKYSYPTASPYQYSSQYQYSSAPVNYSPYPAAPQYSYTPAVKSYATYSPAAHTYSSGQHSAYDASKYSSSSSQYSHNHGYAVTEASHKSQYGAQGVKYVPVGVYPSSGAAAHSTQYSTGNTYQSAHYVAAAQAQQAAEYAAAQVQAQQAAEYAAAQAQAEQEAEYAAAQASAHQAASHYAAAAHAKKVAHYAGAHQSAAHAQYSSAHAASANKYSASYYGHSAAPSISPAYVQYPQPAYPVVQYATAAAPVVGAQYHVPAYKSYSSSGSEHSHKYHGVQSVASQHEEYYVSNI